MRVHALLALLGGSGFALASPIDAPPPPRVTPVFVPPNRSVRQRDLSQKAPARTALNSTLYTPQGCLRTSVTALMMNDILEEGGAGAALVLCQSQRYDLNNTLCVDRSGLP